MESQSMIHVIPIKLPSLLNLRMHWTKLLRMKKKQREEVCIALRNVTIPPLPLRVILTRVGPRKLDDDNLQGAFKYVRDEIARKVGVDDGSSLYTWEYRQRNDPGNKKYLIEIEIVTRQ